MKSQAAAGQVEIIRHLVEGQMANVWKAALDHDYRYLDSIQNTTWVETRIYTDKDHITYLKVGNVVRFRAVPYTGDWEFSDDPPMDNGRPYLADTYRKYRVRVSQEGGLIALQIGSRSSQTVVHGIQNLPDELLERVAKKWPGKAFFPMKQWGYNLIQPLNSRYLRFESVEKLSKYVWGRFSSRATRRLCERNKSGIDSLIPVRSFMLACNRCRVRLTRDEVQTYSERILGSTTRLISQGNFVKWEGIITTLIRSGWSIRKVMNTLLKVRDDLETRYIMDMEYFCSRALRDGNCYQVPETMNSIEAIHNYISRHRIAVKAKPIPQEKFLGLDGQTIEGTGLTVLTPKETTDLVEWGQEMSHCIGSYAETAMESKWLFLAIMKEGQLYANVAVLNGEIMQLYGKYNCTIDEDSEVRRYLNSVLNK